MSNSEKKVLAAVAAPCAHLVVKRWALRNGLPAWQAVILAALAGLAASKLVLAL